MWNKKDNEPTAPASPSPQPPARQAAAPTAAKKPMKSGGSPAVIGPSISIKGDLSGEEDLIIEGRVEGEVRLNQHSVTIGRTGRVHADVFGQSIQVEGEVHGNLTGDNEVVIRNTGRVEGNIVAPRVTLEDGSSFRGAIDMQTPQETQRKAAPTPERKPQGQDAQKGAPGSTRTAGATA